MNQRRVAGGAAAVRLESLESRRLLASGQLDTLFDGDGRAELNRPAALANQPGDLIALPGGKLLASIATYDTIGSYQDVRTALTRYNADGSPDPTFGPGGVRLYDFGWNTLAPRVLREPSGAYLLAGGSGPNAPGGASAVDVRRINPDGSVDPAFSTKASDFGTGQLVDVAIQPSGKILVLSIGQLTRLNADGSLDTTFGSGGSIKWLGTGGFSNVRPWSVAVDAEGRPLVAGSPTNSDTRKLWQAFRYTVDGQPDNTFDADGVAEIFTHASRSFPQDIAPASDGDVVLVGSFGNGFGIARLTGTGAPEAAFNGTGTATLGAPLVDATSATKALPQPDGTVLAVGWYGTNSGTASFVARFTGAGAPDSSYDGDGVRTNIFATQRTAAVAADAGDGALVLAAAATPIGSGAYTTTAARLTPTGTTDAAFGATAPGVTVTQIVGPAPTRATSLFVMPDGRTVTAGFDAQRSQFVVSRTLPGGAPDLSFGGGGTVTLPGSASSSVARVAVDADGRTVIAGIDGTWENNTGLHSDWVVFRLSPNGTPDGTFGAGGRAAFDFGKLDLIRDLHLLPDGRMILQAYDGQHALVRLTAAGGIDATFADQGYAYLPGGTSDGFDVLPDGRFVAVGAWGMVSPSGSTEDARVALLSAAGDVLKEATIPLGKAMGRFQDVRVGPGGQGIYALGFRRASGNSSLEDWVVAKLNPETLALDGSFGAGGIASGPLTRGSNFRSWSILPDGGVVVAQQGPDDLFGRSSTLSLLRLTPGGLRDESFGPNGLVAVDLRKGADDVFDLALSPRGSYVLLGSGDGRTIVARVLDGRERGSISGTIFNDADRDGARDTGEAPLGGRTVFLDLDQDGALDTGEPTQVTAATGMFGFGQLLDGTYVVRQVLPAGWSQTAPAPAGSGHVIALRPGEDAGGLQFGAAAPLSPGQTPFLGKPFVVGNGATTIQAEDFDNGGHGVAYHDLDSANNGGKYRATGVDIGATTDAGGGFNLGFVKTGEWLEYTIDVGADGLYQLDARVAAASSNGKFHVEIDGVNKTGALTVPNTNGWQNWTTVSKAGVSLDKGLHVLRLFMDAAGTSGSVGNFNWLKLTPNNSPPPPPPPPPPPGGQQPYTGAPMPIFASAPATLQAEDFDKGGQGVAYSDVESANLGGKYRTGEGVDIQSTTDAGGGFNVAHVKAGEWLEYTVNVGQAGTYDFGFRVASTGSNGKFHLDVDGANVTGAMTVPNTGGFQAFQTVSKTGVSLSAGTHVLRLAFDTAGSNGSVGNFNWIRVTPSGVVEPPPPTGTTQTLTTTRSTYAVNGGSADTNFGISSQLLVKTSPNSGFTRESFIHFDLSTVTTVSAAKLRLYGKLSDTTVASVAFAIHSAGDAAWDENTLTWNDRPTATTPVKEFTVTGTTAKAYEIDLTLFLQGEKAAGRKSVTLVLKGTTSATGPYGNFNSDDAAGNRPQLIVTA
ncbi:MAG TPA: carbohydrate-binding protein [Tepidisphaeraceae bacterium]|nr:carbohydrate-binding protein [Tepidisphaeraceae bacterium]